MNPKEIIQAQRSIYLISGFIQGSLNESEIKELEAWKAEEPAHQELFDELTNKENQDKAIAGWNTEDTEVALRSVKRRMGGNRRMITWLATAAAVIISVSIYIVVKQETRLPTSEFHAINDVAPGTNKATLTLADGSVINLSDTATGTIAKQAGINITKADGKLVYEAGSLNESSTTKLYNTIKVPKGGHYQVRLPDGSNVWLNAASSLTYSAALNERGVRRVRLDGEAYFEIAHDKSKPFIVVAAGQEVRVLGTHFNINSYANEGKITTTLLQGSVSVLVSNSTVTQVVLKPGQQSLLSGTRLQVQAADTESAMAWKNGMFLFYNKDLKTIMRQLERWYNVEVDMATIPDNQFYGEISRNVKLSEVLAMLGATSNMKFKIEGRKIILQK